MLDSNTLKIVVDSAPLISIDIIVKHHDKVLLGRRINRPAQGYFFTVGGRVYKNETLDCALRRIIRQEMNIELKSKLKFIGVFEHFYEDSIFKDVSTHYVNLAYEYNVQTSLELPTEQHSEYRWFDIGELSDSEQVHKYVKDFFKE